MVTVDCPKQPFARKLPNWVAEQAGGALDEFHRALARQLTFRFGNDEALPASHGPWRTARGADIVATAAHWGW